MTRLPVLPEGFEEAARQLREAAAAKKCWTCGCLQNSVVGIERALPRGERPHDLANALREARQRFAPVKYDCLGCEVCYPALAVNALSGALAARGVDLDACPAEAVSERDGWPPLPGSYTVLRYLAPVAICTLTDAPLADTLATRASEDVALVGTMHTENLGIERLVVNVLANPNIRFLILCGADSEQAIGHLPGQSLAALATEGIDERGRIVGARGKRPVVKNISQAAVEHFRRTVEVLDRIGTTDSWTILQLAKECAARPPAQAEPFTPERTVERIAGYLPTRMIPDPEGYLVVYVDRARHLLALEHYRTDGVLDRLIEGHTAAELYIPAVEKNLLSRLDHAAYLGRELARAEEALRTGAPYVQDAAPELTPQESPAACACPSTRSEVP